MTVNKELVRCIDCIYSGCLVNHVCRCKKLMIGKTGKAKRYCNFFKEKQDGKEKENRDNPDSGHKRNIASNATRRVERSGRKRNVDRSCKSNGKLPKKEGDEI